MLKWHHRYIEGPYRTGDLRKKSFRIFLTALVLMLACAVIFVLYVNHTMSSRDPDVYIVQEGDTLWSIAKEIYGEMQDTRKMVYLMRKLNDIEDPGKLQPGMRLILPVVMD